MLKPAELYKAQGFPANYIISHGADGKPFTKIQQVHMCGNSASPPPMAALSRANDPWLAEQRQAHAALLPHSTARAWPGKECRMTNEYLMGPTSSAVAQTGFRLLSVVEI